MTPVEAVKFVQFVSALWPQQRLEDETPDAWYAAGLKDVDARDAAEAATRLANHKVFISLAEILTEVKALRTERISRPGRCRWTWPPASPWDGGVRGRFRVFRGFLPSTSCRTPISSPS